MQPTSAVSDDTKLQAAKPALFGELEIQHRRHDLQRSLFFISSMVDLILSRFISLVFRLMSSLFVCCGVVCSGVWTKPAEARVLLTKTFQPGQPVPWRFKPGVPATITWIEVVCSILT